MYLDDREGAALCPITDEDEVILPTFHCFYFVAPYWDLTNAFCVQIPCCDGDTCRSWGRSRLLGVARKLFHEKFSYVTSCAVFHSYVFPEDETPIVYFRTIRFKTVQKFKLGF